MQIIGSTPDLKRRESHHAFIHVGQGERRLKRAARLTDTALLGRALDMLQELAEVCLIDFSVPDIVRVCEDAIIARPEHPGLVRVWATSTVGTMYMRLWVDTEPDGLMLIYMCTGTQPRDATPGMGCYGMIARGPN